MAGQFYYQGKKIQSKDLLKRSYMVMQDVDYQLLLIVLKMNVITVFQMSAQH